MSFKLLEIGRTALVAAAICAATAPSPSYARSLLYYFDFDKVENGALVYEGVNKGTGTAEFILNEKSVGVGAGYSGGALGTDHAFCSTTQNSLWLGDGNSSLGCGTAKGFTISFWLKTHAPSKAWYDFMGFRVGDTCYRCEYPNTSSGNFMIYASDSRFNAVGGGEAATEATAGEWKHAAFVFAPGTDTLGTCTLYIGGEKSGTMRVATAGDLKQIILGGWVRNANGTDRTSSYIGATNTSIDELAVFDYPATEEQVKWLGRFRPAQPTNGPGREMPLCWRFHEQSADTRGLVCDNSGTGDSVAYKYHPSMTGKSPGNNDYANWTEDGAFGAPYCFWLRVGNGGSTRYWAAFKADGSGADGLGATVGSGFTFSFWLKAGADMADWISFFGFTLGSRTERLAWNSSNPSVVMGFGDLHDGLTAIPGGKRIVDAWQHVCLVWNPADRKIDVAVDGERVSQMDVPDATSAADAVNMLMLGPKVPGTNVNNNYYNTGAEVYLDELAFFNYSISPTQVSWLAANPPALPPLDATNLVRTVAANGAWAGGLASWGVREWDAENETWAATTRTTIWPALEDTEVEAAVALADGVELTNDTFVTPKRLALTAATGAALPTSATLKSGEGSMLAPESLEIGDGLQLTVPLYAVKVGGTLTLGAGAKIVFDTANYNVGGTTEALTAGAFVLPAGETAADVLSHFGVNDNRFTLSLSADGKTVLVAADAIPVTATWTGAGDGANLGSAANWDCRDGFGALVQDALPCEFTRVIVCSGSAALNAPAGTTIPWQYLRIEAGNATLATDADWCGLGALSVPEGVTVDLAGKKLHLIGQLENTGTITSSGIGGELHVDVPSGSTSANASVAFTGSLRLVKDGEGTFTAACPRQGYTGGTEVTDGTLKLGTNKFPLGPKNAPVKICAGAVYDMDGFFSTSSCIYAYDLAGTFHLATGNRANGWNAAYKCIGSTLTLSGDAVMTGGAFYFANPDGTLALTMNGHTLTFDANERESGQANSYVGLGAIRCGDSGKMVFAGNCTYEWLAAENPSNVAFEVRSPAMCKLGNATDSISVGSLAYAAEKWEKNSSKATRLAVYGRYLAGPMRPPMVMMDGSTLDFSDASLDLTSVYASTTASVSDCTTPGELLFADGATVRMAFGSRMIGTGEPIIRWSAPPANIDTVKFLSAPGEMARSFVKKDDGLYAISGFIILVR